MTGNVTATEFRFANGTSVLSAAAGNPTGTVVYLAGTTAPTGGYLLCDGNVYTRSTYSSLASLIGTPTLLSTFNNLEYANSTWASGANIPYYIFVANGVAFTSNTGAAVSGQYAGGIYTSTDGTSWTARTARSPGFGGQLYYQFTQKVQNGAFAANVSGGVWAIANSFSETVGFTPTFLQTSSDLGTWTNRSISIGLGQAGFPSAQTTTSFGGIAGGGTSNRLVLLLNKYASDGVNPVLYAANTATSDDAGATWSYSNNLPHANNVAGTGSYFAAIASSNSGFVVTHANNAWWSATGQNWQDISANLRASLGVTSMRLNTVHCYGNNFIITTNNGKYITAPSSNGSNGNWTVITPTFYGSSFFDFAGAFNYAYNPRLAYNGQVYCIIDTSAYIPAGSILYSNDLRTWFRKDDPAAPMTVGGYFSLTSFVGLPTNNKFLFIPYTGNYGIYSFTSNGTYNTATQFPVPNLNGGLIPNYVSSVGLPTNAYIKT
jgi:hypothetical protein